MFCLFVLLLYAPSQQLWSWQDASVHLTTLFPGQVTSTLCTYFCLKLTTTLLEWLSGREENDGRNYFMINLQESMGPGQDWTRDPWICSQTRICCQTRYRLHYTEFLAETVLAYVTLERFIFTKTLLVWFVWFDSLRPINNLSKTLL